MLSRKCGQIIGDLMGTGDFNIRVTIVQKITSRFVQKSLADGAWKETFRDAIGGGIIHDSKNYYKVACRTEDKSVQFIVTGNNIINECWKHLINVDVARIDLTKVQRDSKEPNAGLVIQEYKAPRSWIVARD